MAEKKQKTEEQYKKEKEMTKQNAEMTASITTRIESLALLAVRVFLPEYDTRYWVHVSSFGKTEKMSGRKLQFSNIEGALFERKLKPEYPTKLEFAKQRYEETKNEKYKNKSSASVYWEHFHHKRAITSATAKADILQQMQSGIKGINYELAGHMIQIPGERTQNYKLDFARLT